MKRLIPLLSLFLVLAGMVAAQRGSSGGRSRGGWGGGWSGGESRVPDGARTAREVESHSSGTPQWTNTAGHEKDVFTFVRVRRSSGGWGRGGWATDTPDAELNFSYRLQQMTSLKVDPDARYLWLTDKDLSDYPFIYMVEPGSLELTDPEIEALRKYLLNGGFLMFDDFWGEREWANMAEVMKRVFPDRGFTELSLDHALYHCVFEIKSKGQVPNIRTGTNSEFDGVTWERDDAREVHHRVITDDKGRMMVIATHNTDNGDGWEREGENAYYFKNFSEKIAYPLGINIIFYAMTH